MNRQQAVVNFETTRQTKKEKEVLKVASDYFLSHGYQGTSINAMARDSGISKESIYRYFSSKKDLFEAVIIKELADYRKRLGFLTIEYESMPLDAALRQVAESILQAVSNDRVLALRRLIFHEAVQSPDIGAIYYEIGPRAAYEYLEKIFSAHQQETDFTPERLSWHFVSMVLHRIMLQRECAVLKAPTKAEIRQHAKQVAGEFLQVFFRSQAK